MENAWSNYQAAFGLVVGFNLALAALPTLRQPAIDTERRRWQSLLQVAHPSHESHLAVRKAYVDFASLAHQLEKHFNIIRQASWVASLIATAALLWATFDADRAADTRDAAVVLAVGAVPGIALLLLNWHASLRLQASAYNRKALEKTMSI